MRFALWVVIPLYDLLNLQSVIFTIINSPSGIDYDLNTESGMLQYEAIQVASAAINNFFFVSICSSFLILGFSKNAWHTGLAGGPDREYGCLSLNIIYRLER